MICYKKVTASVAITTSWQGMYEGSMVLGSWAQEFIDVPFVNLTNNSSTGCFIESIESFSKTSAGRVYLARPQSYTQNVTICVMAIGRWK